MRTAYFCSIRSPGTVLRESRTRAFVSARASAQARVAVATPDIRVIRFRATRSALSTDRAFALDPEQDVSATYGSAVSCQEVDLERAGGRADQAQRVGRHVDSGQNPLPAGDQLSGGHRIGRDGGYRGDVHTRPRHRPAGPRGRRDPRPARRPRSAERPEGRDPRSATRTSSSSSLAAVIVRSGPGCARAPPTCRSRPPSDQVTRWACQSSRRSSKSLRQWQPRDSCRSHADATTAPATVTRLVASQDTTPGSAPSSGSSWLSSAAAASRPEACRRPPQYRLMARCNRGTTEGRAPPRPCVRRHLAERR